MISFANYENREQSYVKHVLLAHYLEELVIKTASKYSHIVYVDGFAGPWQSANEKYEDTSFGIALKVLRTAKAVWKEKRHVKMSAFLVEKNRTAFEKLQELPPKFRDVEIKTFNDDFLRVLPKLLEAIPQDAFAFFLIDPIGWRIPLEKLRPLLSRQHSETIFNFMFDFINRAASIKQEAVVAGLNELIPLGEWRSKLEDESLTAMERKDILAEAFRYNLAQLGDYPFVAETTVLRPLRDRPLYCLFYATRHRAGIEVFRRSQIKALKTQSDVRAQTKIAHASRVSGQAEMFSSLHEMASDDLDGFFEAEREAAKLRLLSITPHAPEAAAFEKLWPKVMAEHVISRVNVGDIAVELKNAGQIAFTNWGLKQRKPQDETLTQRPTDRA